MDEKDYYLTVANDVENILYKDRNSKFIGFAYTVNTSGEIHEKITSLKKTHSGASHWCYAWQLNPEQPIYRINDDGEPSGSAGMPIYGQIKSYDVTNILLVVIRYYGGTKLGVRGLINAYKNTAKLSLEAATIIEKTIDITFIIDFDYKDIGKVMRIINDHKVKIINKEMHMRCVFNLSVRKKIAEHTLSSLKSIESLIAKN